MFTACYGKREWLGGWALAKFLERAHMLTGGFKRPAPNAKFPALRLHHKGFQKNTVSKSFPKNTYGQMYFDLRSQ